MGRGKHIPWAELLRVLACGGRDVCGDGDGDGEARREEAGGEMEGEGMFFFLFVVSHLFFALRGCYL